MYNIFISTSKEAISNAKFDRWQADRIKDTVEEKLSGKRRQHNRDILSGFGLGALEQGV